jgi:hypothetical protein
VFEVAAGRVDIGASIRFLSQYPAEDEYLMQPLSCLEVSLFRCRILNFLYVAPFPVILIIYFKEHMHAYALLSPVLARPSNRKELA